MESDNKRKHGRRCHPRRRSAATGRILRPSPAPGRSGTISPSPEASSAGTAGQGEGSVWPPDPIGPMANGNSHQPADCWLLLAAPARCRALPPPAFRKALAVSSKYFSTSTLSVSTYIGLQVSAAGSGPSKLRSYDPIGQAVFFWAVTCQPNHIPSPNDKKNCSRHISLTNFGKKIKPKQWRKL